MCKWKVPTSHSSTVRPHSAKRDLFVAQIEKLPLATMPLKIVIQLMNGDQLEYSARLYQGKSKYSTHCDKMENLVLAHFQFSPNEYKVKFIHGDEEEIISSIYKNQLINQHTSEEIQRIEIARILSGEGSGYHTAMDSQRYYFQNTIIYALVEKREKSLDEMMMDWSL